MSTTTQKPTETEVSILTRILDDEEGRLPEEVAHYILTLKFSERDKARMHDLVVRNQSDGLTSAEKDEMHAFGKAGDLLSILKSKARRRLGVRLKESPSS